ncbi:hypothetical protein [Nocardia spumae]|uniref:hypothetical protein n=1 Tax=Nocardia spumae TaxID=2887190 RepID=UPI001D13657C|nr:hypothetical protein [Nocardia spumae]
MAARSVPRPPFSTDLLADLHADNVPPDEAEALWPQVRQDPEAVDFLHSLDSVTAELRALSLDDHILHPMPTEVAARLDALLDELSRGEGPDRVATVHHLYTTSPGSEPPSTRPMPALEAISDEVEPSDTEADWASDEVPPPVSLDGQRAKRWRWFAAAAAAVAVVAGSLVAFDALRDRPVTPNALPAKQSTPLALDEDMSSGAVLNVLGRNDVSGPLAGPGAITSCVKAAIPDRTVLGSTNVTYHGESAVLILLTGPRPPKITALVVGSGCSPADPQILEIRDIG